MSGNEAIQRYKRELNKEIEKGPVSFIYWGITFMTIILFMLLYALLVRQVSQDKIIAVK